MLGGLTIFPDTCFGRSPIEDEVCFGNYVAVKLNQHGQVRDSDDRLRVRRYSHRRIA